MSRIVVHTLAWVGGITLVWTALCWARLTLARRADRAEELT